MSFDRRNPENWEACEDQPDLVRSPRGWLPLDFYLRLERGVQDDKAEDLAAQIVCKAGHLRHAVNEDGRMWLAYELGELAKQFCIYRQLDEARQKPREVRPRSWVNAVAGARVGMGASDRERWEIPEDFEVFTDDGTRWLVSREEYEKKNGERIERFRAYPDDNRKPPPQWGPSCRGFERYLARARKRRRRKQSR